MPGFFAGDSCEEQPIQQHPSQVRIQDPSCTSSVGRLGISSCNPVCLWWKEKYLTARKSGELSTWSLLFWQQHWPLQHFQSDGLFCRILRDSAEEYYCALVSFCMCLSAPEGVSRSEPSTPLGWQGVVVVVRGKTLTHRVWNTPSVCNIAGIVTFAASVHCNNCWRSELTQQKLTWTSTIHF